MRRWLAGPLNLGNTDETDEADQHGNRLSFVPVFTRVEINIPFIRFIRFIRVKRFWME
jgi:hypothetical protein